MKKAWIFGGSEKPFADKLTKGTDVVQFGRKNVDYKDVEGFINRWNDFQDHIPDIIIFNISNNGHQIDLDKNTTSRDELSKFLDIIQSTFYFQLRITEWFFTNFSQKRILFITSNECYNSCIEGAESTFWGGEGDLLLYRMTRALEHQVINQQNILDRNHKNNNKIMGLCVGNNEPSIVTFMNGLILKDEFKRGLYSLTDGTHKTGEVFSSVLQRLELFTINKTE